MKLRSTFILLAICAAVAAYLYFVERHAKTTEELLRDANQVIELDRDKIDSISIRSPETKVELRKNAGGQWALEEPVKDRADTTAVSELLTTTEGLKSDEAVDIDPKNKEQ